MACTLVETLFRRLHEYTFANGDLVSSGVMFDPFVVVEAQHHANVFLRRCNLEVVDVARLLDVSDACSSDNEDQEDHEEIDSAQQVAWLSLNMVLTHIATQDYSQAPKATKAKVAFVVQQLSLYTLVLQMKPEVFDAPCERDTFNKIAAFNQGRLGLLLCSGLGLQDMRTPQGERTRQMLRLTCAEFCLQLCDTVLGCLVKQNQLAAELVVNDMNELASQLLEARKELGVPGEDFGAQPASSFKLLVAELQLHLVDYNNSQIGSGRASAQSFVAATTALAERLQQLTCPTEVEVSSAKTS